MKKTFDTFLFLPAFVLIAIGVVMIFSASSPTAALDPACKYDPFFFVKRHIMWLGIGVVAMLLAFKIDVFKLRKFTLPIMFLSIFLLVLVLIPAFSREILGARRSIALGPLTFQPSEFAKIALILYFADSLSRRKEKAFDLRAIVAPLCMFGIVVLLIEKQPDLGSTLSVAGAVFGMLFMAGVNLWQLMLMGGTGFLLAAMRIMHESYRVKRILAFLNPWQDSQGIGYQIVQSFIALGSGGLYGLGLGESRQKFFYLPEKFTDFIFAIVGEELGLLYGTLPVVLMFVLLLYKGMRIAANSRDHYMSLLAGGITFQIVLQAFINMGVVSGILPCTGIPLPFISFGGSSLVFTLFSLGLLLNVAGDPRRNCNFKESVELTRKPRFGTATVSAAMPAVMADKSIFRKTPRNNGEKECKSSSQEEEPAVTPTRRSRLRPS